MLEHQDKEFLGIVDDLAKSFEAREKRFDKMIRCASFAEALTQFDSLRPQAFRRWLEIEQMKAKDEIALLSDS